MVETPLDDAGSSVMAASGCTPSITPGPMIVAYTAEEGSPDAERLQLLARLVDTPEASSRPAGAPEVVPPTTLRLLRATTAPALVVSRYLDVLAWNPLAGALLGDPGAAPRRERNMIEAAMGAPGGCPRFAGIRDDIEG